MTGKVFGLHFTGGVLCGGICANSVKYIAGGENSRLNYYVYQTTPYDIRELLLISVPDKAAGL